MSPMSRRRGSMATGILASAVVAVLTFIAVLVGRGYPYIASLAGFAVITSWGLLAALAIALLVGLPAHVALSRRRVVSLVPYLFIGAIAALIPALLLAPPNLRWREVTRTGVFFMPCGAIAAAVFWVVSVRGWRRD